MELTFFFAKFWGAFFVVFGLLSIVPGQLDRTIAMTENKAFVVSIGYLSFLMGLVVAIVHNVWVWDWPVVITVFGWSAMIKGIIRIGWPETVHKQAQRLRKNQWISITFLILLGSWLLWMGFQA